MNNYRIGNVYNELTILSIEKKRNRIYLNCMCSCGNIKNIRADSVASGGTKTCGKCFYDVNKKEINRDYLIHYMNYDKETGLFTWKRILKNGKQVMYGNAGSISKKGYWVISLNYMVISAHRLAFLYMDGVIPDSIDHINQNKLDNRWTNLRAVSNIENMKNQKLRSTNKTGMNGVSLRNGSYQARVMHNYKAISLGSYSDFFEACCARKSADIKYGFSKLHGMKQ